MPSAVVALVAADPPLHALHAHQDHLALPAHPVAAHTPTILEL